MQNFYITRTNGNWEVVSPIRRRYAFNLEEAVEILFNK